ncbi:MAG: hypothetical protein H7Y03_12415 [Chitinophagaceae bacterium]|nr:hypothetical protein [Chitinophagaceae bacterium]
MQFIKSALRLIVFFLPVFGYSQSVTIPQGSKFQQLLDRMEIREQTNLPLNVSSGLKPNNRKLVTLEAAGLDSLKGSMQYTPVDLYNIERLLINNQEWVQRDSGRFASRHSWWRTFYKTPSDFIQVDEKDFFLVVNPIFQFQQSKEADIDDRIFLNSRGAMARGLIAGKVGFDFYLTENQERMPLFVREIVQKNGAVPGAGFYKPFKTTGYDYIDGRGSVYFSAAKYIHLQFGYDKNFIGNGYRSLFLSDFANSALFLKINTRIWKLDYQNLFMELVPQYRKQGDDLLPRKYMASHHLSLQATKWLNIGLFESVIFGRQDRFDFTYLNPVIFLRLAEQQAGSPDNALVGLDFKANIAKRFQLYGQLLIDEFKLSEIRSGNGWWANKFGIQAGAKYIDAFGVRNLDLQGEVNVVRPFTYSHSDSVANYTHYNQPMAHPLGANFAEAIGIIRYQPLRKWYGQIRVIGFRQGRDTADNNNGTNIFLPYGSRAMDYGYKIGSGVKTNGVNASLWIGYELRENLFIDASFLHRKLSAEGVAALSPKTTVFTLGLRLNMSRKEYDY